MATTPKTIRAFARAMATLPPYGRIERVENNSGAAAWVVCVAEDIVVAGSITEVCKFGPGFGLFWMLDQNSLAHDVGKNMASSRVRK